MPQTNHMHLSFHRHTYLYTNLLAYYISYSVCNVTPPLSLDRDILPLNSIEGSSPVSLENLVGSGSDNEWCSNQPLSEEPWIQLNFTTTVSLVYMVARGDAGRLFPDDNVRAFRLEFLDEETGNFTTYGVTDEPTVSRTNNRQTNKQTDKDRQFSFCRFSPPALPTQLRTHFGPLCREGSSGLSSLMQHQATTAGISGSMGAFRTGVSSNYLDSAAASLVT